MQVRRPWHSEMLNGTWMDAPGRKEIKKCRSVGDSIQECSLGHGWMHLPGKKSKKAGPSAMGFGNVHWDMGGCTCPEKNKKKGGPSAMGFGNDHWDMDGCTCPEKNKKMQVRRPWHSEMLTGTWMDAPGWKEIKKWRSEAKSI